MIERGTISIFYTPGIYLKTPSDTVSRTQEGAVSAGPHYKLLKPRARFLMHELPLDLDGGFCSAGSGMHVHDLRRGRLGRGSRP